MTFVQKVQPYSVITLDLSIARIDSSQGAIDILGTSTQDWVANSLTVVSMSSTASLSLRLGDVDAPRIPVSDQLQLQGVTFREIYYYNTAQPGETAYLFLTYVDS